MTYTAGRLLALLSLLPGPEDIADLFPRLLPRLLLLVVCAILVRGRSSTRPGLVEQGTFTAPSRVPAQRKRCPGRVRHLGSFFTLAKLESLG